MKLVKLETLEPGRRFRFPDSGRTGAVVAHGNSGSRVKFDHNARQVEIEIHGEVVASFESPGKPIIISSGSEVEVL